MFAQPAYLAAAAGVALAIVTLHLLIASRSTSEILPTARFLPPETGIPRRIRMRLSDVLLMLMRVVIVLLIGAALANPTTEPAKRAGMQLLAVDRSSVVDSAEVADSVAAYAEAAHTIFQFGDSIGPPSPISIAVISALQKLAELRLSADTLELIVISPVTNDQIDAATLTIAQHWPGTIKVVRVGLALKAAAATGRIEVRTDRDDPINAAIVALNPRTTAAAVRVTRATPSAADMQWARAHDHVLVHWPEAAPTVTDTARGIYSPGTGVVTLGHFKASTLKSGGRSDTPVLLWLDGTAAAVERIHGDGCVREVGFDPPTSGDFVLRPSFAAILDDLFAPCRNVVSGQPAEIATIAALGLAANTRVVAWPNTDSTWPLWLLVAAAACAVLEMFVRRRMAARQAK